MTLEVMFQTGSKGDWVVLIQRMLNKLDFTKNGLLTVDGNYGPKTQSKVRSFQNWRGLMADGIVGVQTFQELIISSMNFTSELKRDSQKFLTDEDITYAANLLDVDRATIKAVVEVESAGSGFIADKPKILFEGHVFWKLLKKNGWNPDSLKKDTPEGILYRHWTTEHYRGGLAEYERLNEAKQIHPALALQSCSWGLFQIMGYHWEALQYHSANHFVECMYENEGQHLFAFIKYIKKFKLAGHLKEKDWASFAKEYNGPRYYENQYDVRLRKAYEKYKNN